MSPKKPAKSTNADNQSQSTSVRDCVLGLLAMTLPAEQYAAAVDAEVSYLQPYFERYQHLTTADWLKTIDHAIEQTGDIEKRLLQLARHQQLSLHEILALFLCYLVESDPMTGRCIAYLQQPFGASRPTLSLLDVALSPVSDKDESNYPDNLIAALANSRAVQLDILQVLNESLPLPERPVQIPASLALIFGAGLGSWPGARIGLGDERFDLPESILLECKLQAAALQGFDNGILVIRSAAQKESAVAAATIASYLQLTPIFIDDQARALPALGPVCLEKKLIPVLSYDCGPGEQIQLPAIQGYSGALIILAGVEGAFDSNSGTVTSWFIPKPSFEERRQLWQVSLQDDELATQLATDHVHSTSRILELAKLTKHQSLSAHIEKPGLEDVRKAAWLSESGGLTSLAQPIQAEVVDKALIVRDYTQQQLQLLEQRCRLREHLGDDLGITLKARYQMGVKVLFAGPSGTGKTLAASWLATKLGLPLYRVDLASITSKYVGETEKQLAKLLAQAEQEEVILLFDEADSLFGKRTDVKDANDRYANSQTNYLLQRVETYSGIIVLTSNTKARFDAAFTRRLDSIISFTSPDPEERRLIWLRHLGTHHSLDKPQINQLAEQCDFSGGHIRNVVLSAAVIAKQDDRKISIEDIVKALVYEYRKLGRQMPPELAGFLQPILTLEPVTETGTH